MNETPSSSRRRPKRWVVVVSLVFGVRSAPPAASSSTPLDPKRRLYTIIASLSLFAVILAYSAIRLTPPILERWRGER